MAKPNGGSWPRGTRCAASLDEPTVDVYVEISGGAWPRHLLWQGRVPRDRVAISPAGHRPLAPHEPLFSRPAAAADVIQTSSRRDCTVAASMLAVLHARGASYVQSLFEDHGDTVTVHLHRVANGVVRAAPVRVRKTLQPAAAAPAGGAALWWQMAQKALALLGWPSGGRLSHTALCAQPSAVMSMQAFTGLPARVAWCGGGDFEALGQLLRSIADSAEPLCWITRPTFGVPLGCTWREVPFALRHRRYAAALFSGKAVAGLQAGHCYAVTGVRRHSGGGWQVQLTNPLARRGVAYRRGRAYPCGERIFWLEMRDFMRYGLACVSTSPLLGALPGAPEI